MKNKQLLAGILILSLGASSHANAEDQFTNGLVAYYPFNGNANDASGNGNNGTIISATFAADRFGNANTAVAFDGTSSEVMISNSPSLNPVTAISLGAWFKANVGFSSNRLVQKGSNDNQYAVRFHAAQTVFELRGTSNFQLITGPPSIGVWHHLVGTYDGVTMKLYLDGSLSAQQASSGAINTSTNPADYLAIGNKPPFSESIDHFDGLIDQVRIYNRALSDSEVQRLYAFESGHSYTSVAKAVRLDHEFLKAGTNYQLQISHDLNTWTNLGSPFTATASTNLQYLDVGDWNAFFRLIVP